MEEEPEKSHNDIMLDLGILNGILSVQDMSYESEIVVQAQREIWSLRRKYKTLLEMEG